MSIPQELIEQFLQGPGQVRAAIEGMTAEESMAKPGPGEWSAHEVIIHLADSDGIGIDRMKRVIAEESPTLLGYDETAFAKRLHVDKQTIEDALLQIEVGRRQFGRVLRELSSSDFDRVGQHNERGPLSLHQLLQTYVEHFEHHLKFVTAKLARLRGNPTADVT